MFTDNRKEAARIEDSLLDNYVFSFLLFDFNICMYISLNEIKY